MPCPPSVPISIIPPVSQGVGPLVWANGSQVARLTTPLNPSWLVYDGAVTRWGDGSATAPVLLPALQEVDANLIQYNVGTLANGQLAKTAGLPTTIANDLSGGAAGEVVYQIGLNQTGFTAVGNSAQLLQSNATSAPTWIGANDLAVTATGSTTARNLANRFTDTVSVKDFGAVGNGVTDDTVAVQAFFDYVTSTGSFGIITEGVYLISSKLTITIGGYGFSILGAGNGSAFFQASSSFGSTPVINIIGTVGSFVSWVLGGFTITTVSGYTGSATCGLQIGNPNSTVDINGYLYSTIQNVHISNFPILWNIVHARMIKFNNCSGWTTSNAIQEICLNIYQNGYFTGDFVFDTCQFVSYNQNGKIVVNLLSNVGSYSPVSGNHSLSGIKFINCLLYSGETCVNASVTNGAYLSDIWFTNVQIDQQTTNCFSFAASGSGSTIENIHIADCYMVSATNVQILFSATSSANITSVYVHDSYLNQTANIGIAFYVNSAGAQNIEVNNNTFTDPNTPTSLISFNNATRFVCSDNVVSNVFGALSALHLIQIESGCSSFFVSGNNSYNFTVGSVINDLSGNVVKSITNNIGYNPIGLQTITVGTSPYAYVNTSGATQIVTVANGTVTALNNGGIAMGVLSGGNYVVVPAGGTLTVTYSSLPNMYSQGL